MLELKTTPEPIHARSATGAKPAGKGRCAWRRQDPATGCQGRGPIQGESLMCKKMSRVHHSITNHSKYVVSCLLFLLLFYNLNAYSILFQTINQWEEGVWIRCGDWKEMQLASPSMTSWSDKDKAQMLDSMGSSVACREFGSVWEMINCVPTG